MGVYRTDYLMYGVKVDPKLVDYDKHEALMDGRPDAPFTIIYDGMGGQYAVAGKIIAQSGEHDGVEFTEITDDLLPDNPAALAQSIRDELGVEPDKLRLYLFSHFH